MGKELWLGVGWGVAAQFLTYVQTQAQFRWGWVKENTLLWSLWGIPVSYCFMMSVRYLVQWANAGEGLGEDRIWPSRLIGQGIGIIMFTLLTLVFFGEGVNVKTGVCLGLGIIILLIQIFL
jgi:hypothetical protein